MSSCCSYLALHLPLSLDESLLMDAIRQYFANGSDVSVQLTEQVKNEQMKSCQFNVRMERNDEDGWDSRLCLSPFGTEGFQVELLNESKMKNLSRVTQTDSSRDTSLSILLVGAGGVGCEILKCLAQCLSYYPPSLSSVHIIDLDTVDVTNLNRQFLFGEKDVGTSKALAAARAIQHWFPALSCTGEEVNICDWSLSSFTQFDVVMNALDNVSARRHVNQLCVSAGLPLVESGTMGHNGQAQTIVPQLTECYDCRPKPSDQPSFAVCTIHAKPTRMIHCAHFARELYDALFTVETNSEFGELPSISTDNFGLILFKLIFETRLKEQIQLAQRQSDFPIPFETETLWSTGLSVENGTLETRQVATDSQILASRETANIFVTSANALAVSEHRPNAFQKDNSLAACFVAATANLRATAFGILPESFLSVTTLASRIIPSYAAANALVAGAAVNELLKLVKSGTLHRQKDLATVSTVDSTLKDLIIPRSSPSMFCLRHVPQLVRSSCRRRHKAILHSFPSPPPSPTCPVCSVATKRPRPRVGRVSCNASQYTLWTWLVAVVQRVLNLDEPWTVYGQKGSQLLFETGEFETLKHRELSQLLEHDSAEWLVEDGNGQEWHVTLKHSDADITVETEES